MNEQFAIWARRTGGALGPKEAWLKKNGEIEIYETREEAGKRAAELNRDTKSPNVSYSSQPYEKERERQNRREALDKSPKREVDASERKPPERGGWER